MAFEIRFWGVRGSIASPGRATAGVGGNTSSVEVRCGDSRILLDAGTGLRRLGDALQAEGRVDATLLLSHLHWDHIQGLPFFVPLYLPSTRLRIWGPRGERRSLADVLGQQMGAPVFPVDFRDVASRIEVRELRGGERLQLGAVEVMVARLNHPGGAFGYRIQWGGRSMVYATDTEHRCCIDPRLGNLARDADVLVYDAQYTPEEYRGDDGPSKVGWGHSTWESGVELAHAANVRQLVLFHHDPKRSDTGVQQIEARARARFANTLAAREGMTLELGGRVVQAA